MTQAEGESIMVVILFLSLILLIRVFIRSYFVFTLIVISKSMVNKFLLDKIICISCSSRTCRVCTVEDGSINKHDRVSQLVQ